MDTRPITTHFDKQDGDAIARLADATDRSMSAIVRIAVRHYLSQQHKRPAQEETEARIRVLQAA